MNGIWIGLIIAISTSWVIWIIFSPDKHVHKWEIVGEPHYVPGYIELQATEFGGMVGDRRELLFGFTTISLKCSECGYPFYERIIGKWSEVPVRIDLEKDEDNG